MHTEIKYSKIKCRIKEKSHVYMFSDCKLYL